MTVLGLQPGAFYVARVALVNSNEFSSRSAAIRFRTKPASSDDFFTATPDGHETDNDGGVREPVPRIRAYRGLKDITPASPLSAPMARESSSGLGPRRNTGGRRPSPVALGLDGKHDPQPDDSEPPEGAETIQQLTEKLDAIRRETDESERQSKEEEEEELRQKDELTKERDELKAEVTEKEKVSKNLKREVTTLERQNTAAQNERAKQERLLQQKKQERQKLKDNMVKWEREAEEMKRAVERIQKVKLEHLEEVAQERDSLRARQAEEQTKMKAVDDQVKEKTSEIKKLERALRNNSPSTNEPDANANITHQPHQGSDAEAEHNWHIHKNNLQQQYGMAYSKVENAKRFYAEQMRYLESLRAERRRLEETTPQYASPLSPALERLPRRGDSQRSRHAPPSRHGGSASDSPRLGTFPAPATVTGVGQSPFGGSRTLNPPTGSTTSGFGSGPFFNPNTAMTFMSAPTDDLTMSEEDKDRLTSGAPMSPGAGAELLPADLFASDDQGRNVGIGSLAEHVQVLPGLGSFPGMPALPGPGPQGQGQSSSLETSGGAPGPASPASASSRSPSVFVSPQASQNHLPHLGSPEAMHGPGMDADRRSIRSTRSNRATSGGNTSSRFSGMFGIKQRNKAMSEEGPPLGKANSMPRQDGQGLPGLSGLDAASRKRNSSISGAGSGMDGGSDSPAAAAAPPGGGRRFVGALFSKDRSSAWPTSFAPFGRRPTSPQRPDSTHSNELPRPSMDSSRWGADAWPSSSDAASGGARNSPLSFGPGWNLPSNPTQSTTSRLYGSRHPSRRPSVQYGASGPPEDIMEDEDDDDDDEDDDALDPGENPNLAPIGTKPPFTGSKKAADTTAGLAGARLNPNAKDFRSFLSSMKFGGKEKDKEKGDRGASSDGAGEGSSTTPIPIPIPIPSTSVQTLGPAENGEDSPPNSRKSRDTRSMTTTESSIAESALTDLARTHSYSANSDSNAPSPALPGSSKETLMQKITRKSSSGKFALPTYLKREKSRLDPSAQGVSAREEEEEDEMSASLGSLREMSTQNSASQLGKEANRGSRTWSSVLKLGKGSSKKGEERMSLSEASGAEEEEEDEGDEEG